MKLLSTLLLNLLFISSLWSQFQIGTTDITFTDPARSNRSIPVEIHYPAMSTGTDVAATGSNHPIIVVGHGFLMGVDAYLHIVDSLVPLGYIVGLVDTETGFPDHAAFGEDLAYAVTSLQQEGSNSGSILSGVVGTTSAIMGHSMGGGASFLAAENNTNITCMVSFAAAETTPSAISAATSIIVPTLILAGSEDCITPPADNQLLMYNDLASDCKTYIDITGAGHCKFATSNFTCELGEITCGSGSLSREDQHAMIFKYLIPFYNYYLKNDAAAWASFNGNLTNDTGITYQQNCLPISTEQIVVENVRLFPNPASHVLEINGEVISENVQLAILNIHGQKISEINLNAGQKLQHTFNIHTLSSGLYFVRIQANDKLQTFKFIKD